MTALLERVKQDETPSWNGRNQDENGASKNKYGVPGFRGAPLASGHKFLPSAPRLG